MLGCIIKQRFLEPKSIHLIQVFDDTNAYNDIWFNSNEYFFISIMLEQRSTNMFDGTIFDITWSGHSDACSWFKVICISGIFLIIATGNSFTRYDLCDVQGLF